MNLNDIYHWIGYVVIWTTIGGITLAIVGFLVCALWYWGIKKVWMNDWFAYNIRRHKIPTEKLREGYAAFKMNKYWTRQTAMYRLRNIKNLRKWTIK